MIRAVSIIARCTLISAVLISPALGDPYNAGIRLFERGKTAQAVEKMRSSQRPDAPLMIGFWAENGKIPGCDQNCALDWYRRSVARDHVPALLRIAILFWNDGQQAKAIECFNLAARFNNEAARTFLSEIGKPVPGPDLYEAQQAQLRERAALRQAQIADQRAQQQQLLALTLAGVAAYNAGRNSTVAALPQGMQRDWTPPPASTVATPSMKLCPDGTYIYGNGCHIAPDGTYVGGIPRIAPDGSFVSGIPTLTPDGTFVGGSGRTTMCPNGQFVAGRTCQLAPNGQYVGIP